MADNNGKREREKKMRKGKGMAHFDAGAKKDIFPFQHTKNELLKARKGKENRQDDAYDKEKKEVLSFIIVLPLCAQKLTHVIYDSFFTVSFSSISHFLLLSLCWILHTELEEFFPHD